MSTAADFVASRIIVLNEEGFRADVYDDADGSPILVKGQPTIGYGTRCRQWSRSLARAVLGFTLTEFETPLLLQSWYRACNDARRSALLEIAYNQGDAGLERGYPKLIAAVTARDYAQAAEECTVAEPALKPRYARIARILSTGVAI